MNGHAAATLPPPLPAARAASPDCGRCGAPLPAAPHTETATLHQLRCAGCGHRVLVTCTRGTVTPVGAQPRLRLEQRPPPLPTAARPAPAGSATPIPLPIGRTAPARAPAEPPALVLVPLADWDRPTPPPSVLALARDGDPFALAELALTPVPAAPPDDDHLTLDRIPYWPASAPQASPVAAPEPQAGPAPTAPPAPPVVTARPWRPSPRPSPWLRPGLRPLAGGAAALALLACALLAVVRGGASHPARDLPAAAAGVSATATAAPAPPAQVAAQGGPPAAKRPQARAARAEVRSAVEAYQGGRDGRVAGLPPEVVQRVLAGRSGDLLACLTGPAALGALDAGRLALTLTVLPDGTVRSPALAGAPGDLGEAEGCVRRTTSRLIFPAFRGSPLQVVVPLRRARTGAAGA